MLKTDVLTLGDYQTNCYILREAGEKTCCVVDPGYEPETILGFLEEKGLTLGAILLTHGHFDHAGAVYIYVRKIWRCRPCSPTERCIIPTAIRTEIPFLCGA